ncbi:lipase family protein [Rhodococcus baikonurensis]|uniref:lipase family protein n=1 Tax=Rhodococcus baikonurensis TaxID=172041 RepID=UPI00379BF34D
MSYQHIINALGLGCAPSTAMYTDDPKLAIREAPGLNVAIAKGWSVAIPDHLGPSSAYGAAKLGGQITLDGIRAAQQFDSLGLGASPVGMAGYSGGGMATAMAAAIAPTYARGTRTRGQRLRRRSDEHRQDGQGPGPAKTPGIRAGYGRGARSRT